MSEFKAHMLYFRKQRGEMKRQLTTSVKRANERGDTIVEVLLSLAVLGAVLGGAYVVTNRSVIVNRVAQERLDAVKLAEGQFERLKIEASIDATTFGKDNFCLPKDPTLNNETVPSSDARCQVNANGDPVGSDFQPRYRLTVANVASVDTPSVSNAGTRFRISIAWDNFSGDGTDRLDQFYEVYR